jgi:hypothetical protein
MSIKFHTDAKIKVEHGSFVISRAFDIDGKYHDLVISDGDQELTKEKLNLIGESTLREKAKNIFNACLASADQSCVPKAPLEKRCFVYKKNFNKDTQTGTSGETGVEAVVSSHPKPYRMVGKEIHDLFTDLNDFLNSYVRVDVKDGDGKPGSKTSGQPTQRSWPRRFASSVWNAMPSLPKWTSANTSQSQSSGSTPSGAVSFTPEFQQWMGTLKKNELVFLQQKQGEAWLENQLKQYPQISEKLREPLKKAFNQEIAKRLQTPSS